MNTTPVFTDCYGSPMKPPRRGQPRPLKEWQRFALSALIVLAGPLLLMGAVTQIDAGTQLKGVVKIVNGGTGTSSTITGLVRGSGSAMTGAELSGDATTSGSNAVTVVRINGTTVPTNAAADQVLRTTSAGVATWATLGDTSAGGLALTYNATTDAFGTIAVISGSFADNETPSGTINGSNDTFTVANTPNPAASVQLFKNGQLMIAGGADFTLSTATITFVAGAIPQTGDVLRASYRY